MILTKNVILDEIKNKTLKITPFNTNQVGPGSIDLTLDRQFRVFKRGLKKVTVTERTDYKKYTDKLITDKLTLQPGEIILGITKEKIELPEDLCGWLQGRTRFARMGLTVHITASFVQPGSKNKQVLEIINTNDFPLEIKAGTRIVQIILQRTEGKARLSGKWVNQKL